MIIQEIEQRIILFSVIVVVSTILGFITALLIEISRRDKQ